VTHALRGPGTALLTPLSADRSLDTHALSGLLRHVTAHGMEFVLVLGSSGEGALLPRPLRTAAVAQVCAELGGRHAVVAAVSGSALTDVISEARDYLAAGVTAILAPPPLYGPESPPRTEAWYRAIADAGIRPLLAYHIPRLTGAPVDSVVAGILAADGVLSGVKDSGRDLEYLQDVADRVSGVPGFALLTGVDSLLLPALQLGATGSITVGANIAPALVRSLYDLVRAGELEQAASVNRRLARLATALRMGIFPAGAKAAAELVGLCERWTAEPTPPLDDAAVERLSAALRHVGLDHELVAT
jgi:4-hydroxy-tetrahydrodipicolinate synthase